MEKTKIFTMYHTNGPRRGQGKSTNTREQKDFLLWASSMLEAVLLFKRRWKNSQLKTVSGAFLVNKLQQ